MVLKALTEFVLVTQDDCTGQPEAEETVLTKDPTRGGSVDRGERAVETTPMEPAPQVPQPSAPYSPLLGEEPEFEYGERQEDVPEVREQSRPQEDPPDVPAEPARVQEEVAQGTEQPQQSSIPSVPDAAVVVVLSESETEEEEDSEPSPQGSRMEINRRSSMNTAEGNEAAPESERVKTGKRMGTGDAAAGCSEGEGGDVVMTRKKQKKSPASVEVLHSRASNTAEEAEVVHLGGRDMRSPCHPKELAISGSTGLTAWGDPRRTREPLVYTRLRDKKEHGRSQFVDAWLSKGGQNHTPAPRKEGGDGSIARTISWAPRKTRKSLVVARKDVPVHGPCKEGHDAGVSDVVVSKDHPILQSSAVPPDQGVLGSPSRDETEEQGGVRVRAASGDPSMTATREGLLMGITVDNQQDSLVDVAPLNPTERNKAVSKLDITSIATALVDAAMVALGEDGEGDESEVLDAAAYEGEVATKVGIVDRLKDLCALTSRNELAERPLHENEFFGRRFLNEKVLATRIRSHKKSSQSTEACRQAHMWLYESVFNWAQPWQWTQPERDDDNVEGVPTDTMAGASKAGKGSGDGNIVVGASGDKHICSRGGGGGVATDARAGARGGKRTALGVVAGAAGDISAY